MHNAVLCTLSLCDVIGIMRHLQIKLKLFSNIAQYNLYIKKAVRCCSFLYIIAKKSVIMSGAFLVDVWCARVLSFPNLSLSLSHSLGNASGYRTTKYSPSSYSAEVNANALTTVFLRHIDSLLRMLLSYKMNNQAFTLCLLAISGK